MVLVTLDTQPEVYPPPQDPCSSLSGFKVVEPSTTWSGAKVIWGNSGHMTGDGREFLIPWDYKTLALSPITAAGREPGGSQHCLKVKLMVSLSGGGGSLSGN